MPHPFREIQLADVAGYAVKSAYTAILDANPSFNASHLAAYIVDKFSDPVALAAAYESSAFHQVLTKGNPPWPRP